MRKNPSLKETAYERDITKLALVFHSECSNKNPQLEIYHRSVCRLYGRHACGLYSLITHKLDKPPYYLPILCNPTNYKPRTETLELSSSEHRKMSFKLLEIFLDAQKACVLLNTARYVLSNLKPFVLLPKTLPNSANLFLQSRKN